MSYDFLVHLFSHVIIINFIFLTFVIFILLLYKYIFPKRNLNPFAVVFCLSILPLISFLRNGIPDSYDFIIHTVLTAQFYATLADGHLFPQWAADSLGGYGNPAFIFFYQLPYYIGSLFRALGFGLIDSTKLLLASSFLLSCTTMYLWAKNEFGEWGGVVATIFYQFTAYHLIELHTFAAVGETVAFAVMPLPFLCLRKFILTERYVWFLAGAVCFSLAILAHQSLGLFSLPLLLIYSFILCKEHKKGLRIFLLSIFSLFLGGLLMTYYWLPMLVLVKYVVQSVMTHYVESQPFFDFIYSPWGYGFLYQGNDARIRWIIGYAHWIIIFLAIFLIFKKAIPKIEQLRIYYYLAAFLLLFIAMQQFVQPFWRLPLLDNFRENFRLLLFESFFSAALAAEVYNQREQLVKVLISFPVFKHPRVVKIILRKKIKSVIADLLLIVLCLFTVVSSIFHWQNRQMLPTTDAYIQKYDIPFMASHEVIPILLNNNPSKLTDVIPGSIDSHKKMTTVKHTEILKGKASITELSRQTTRHTYQIKATSEVTIKENTAYFPGWMVKANGHEIPINATTKKYLGVITFILPKGTYYVEVNYQNTPIRQISERISLITLLVLLLYPAFSYIFAPSFKRRLKF